MNRILPRHPEMYDDESIEGYVTRLAVSNFTTRKYFEMNKLNPYSEEQDFEEYINHITNHTGHKYDQVIS